MRSWAKKIRDARANGNEARAVEIETQLAGRREQNRLDYEEAGRRQAVEVAARQVPDGFFKCSLSGKIYPNSEMVGLKEINRDLNKILNPLFKTA